MIVFLFDGTFEGLLTCVYEAYYNVLKPDNILSQTDFQHNLIDEPIMISTDAMKTQKVYDAIENKISSEALSLIFYTSLSEFPESPWLIFNYIKLGFKYGSKINLHLYDDTVLKIHKISDKVKKECHNMLGFVRFDLIEHNIYYSSIQPDFYILPLLAPHFEKRLSDQNWIIHDVKRNKAIVYNTKDWFITEFDSSSFSNLPARTEQTYERLWRTYFQTATIASRENPKLQKAHMPVRYWKHLTEFKKL